jgi:hypothetical protein
VKRTTAVAVLLVPVTVFGGCLIHSALTAVTVVTVPEVEQKVDRALSIGSTRAEIEAWLAGQGLESSFSDQPASFSYIADHDPVASNYKGVVVSIIRDTDRSPFVTGNIQVYFLLGSDGRLARRLVRWVGTGP